MKLSGFKLLPPVTLVILTAALAIGAFQVHWNARVFTKPAVVLQEFQFVRNLAPRTPVTIYVDIEECQYENIFVRTIYVGLKLFADDILIYECGQQGSYPAWLLDPPPLNSIVPLPEKTKVLRFDYISPSQINYIELYPLIAGSEGAILAKLISENGALFFISLFFLLIGLAVSVISLLYWSVSKGMLYLGLLALVTGSGGLGECLLTALFVPYPALLNLIGIIGLFTFGIPLLRFIQFILNPRNPAAIHIAVTGTTLAVSTAVALHLLGIAAIYKALQVYHLISLACVLTCAGVVIWEYVRYQNKTSKQFIPPTIIVIVMALLELANYYLRFNHVTILFLLIGTFIAYIWLGYIGIKRIFEIQKETEAVKEREQQLAKENASLDSINRLKTDLMRTISHEMRTPLAVISGFAEITAESARQNIKDDQTAKNLDVIAGEAKRMTDMMEEMRQLALAKEYSKDRRPVDIGAVINQIARLYARVLERKGTELKLNVADNLPSVYANENELTQVLFNLLRNAETHIAEGEITITAGTEGSFVKVIVSDTGTGITPELLPRVFERGVRGGEDGSAGGSGYGLAICRDIIMAFEGEIRIESRLGEGTAVTFTLPVIET